MTPSDKLLAMIESLPPNERERVEEYVEFVAKEVSANIAQPEMQFGWAGGLSEFRDKFNAIGLQKKAMEWMSGVSR
jgi:hypothetical protein